MSTRGRDQTSPSTEPFDWADVERVYAERTTEAVRDDRLAKFKGTSLSYFQDAPAWTFDFIYIDGDHTGPDRSE